jgi:small multidrug resistance pump
MNGYVALGIAVVAEVIATASLKASEGFTNPIPSAIVIAGYGCAFYFLSLTLKTIPVGLAYALWSGIGIVLIAAIGWLFFDQRLDWMTVAGMALIVTGIVVINLSPAAAVH